MSEQDALSDPISGHVDPVGEVPWSMQLVAHVEKGEPPTHSAICEAAAIAVVTLLADERAQRGGEWFDAVQRWEAGRIRKHARRARGAAWVKVQALPGVTASTGGAQVRAFVPCPVDAVDRDVAKLQMQGFELADPAPVRSAVAAPSGPVVVSICPVPALGTGKAAAAAGHAAQIARMTMPAPRLDVWERDGFQVMVEHPDADRWEQLRQLAQVEVVDAGFTEVAPNTVTALARWA